ncbi:MAG: hypothetical protein AAFP16_07790 [Pseudomonadota bacterium]
MTHSWTEVQAVAVRAASGAGVPPAQALAFGAMLARHVADGGSEAPLIAALDAPDRIVALAHQVEELIEAASVTDKPVKTTAPAAGERALLVSWLQSLPCRSVVEVSGPMVAAVLDLAAPGKRSRPPRLELSNVLYQKLQDLAALTYVPDSEASRTLGAGAQLMQGT